MDRPRLRILLIEDDEDDYILVQELFLEVNSSVRFNLDWVTSYNEALEEISLNRHDVYLLDYRLGSRNGMDLLREMIECGCTAPIILLTGQGDYEVDIEAMKAGAADYLVKGQINSHLLERSIRYAIERKRSEKALRESEKQLKFLSSQLLTTQEEERKRIARELHDSIGSSLSAIKFSLENTLELMERGVATPESIKVPISITQHAIEESRRIMTDLRPSILDDLGIVTTIGWFCRQFQSIYSRVHIEKVIGVGEEEIPEDLKIVIFRVIQEAFHNIAKYSKAELVSLSLIKHESQLQLTIEDNGTGFAVDLVPTGDKCKGGLGLTSMKERTELSGGCFCLESTVGEGTVIRAVWRCE